LYYIISFFQPKEAWWHLSDHHMNMLFLLVHMVHVISLEKEWACSPIVAKKLYGFWRKENVPLKLTWFCSIRSVVHWNLDHKASSCHDNLPWFSRSGLAVECTWRIEERKGMFRNFTSQGSACPSYNAWGKWGRTLCQNQCIKFNSGTLDKWDLSSFTIPFPFENYFATKYCLRAWHCCWASTLNSNPVGS